MKNLRFLENADKAEAGKKANEVRELLSRLFEEKSKRILEGQKEERLRQERIDVSLPAHPVDHSH